MNFNLQGKTAIIGGSSKGLGKACAVALAREGVNIVLCARNEVSLHEAQREIEALGVQTLALTADMTSADDNVRIVRETVAHFGGVDILVNNSGGPKPGNFREISDEDLDDAYHAVLKYNIRMIRLCLPFMEKKEWGRIVNITSITVKEPASKYGAFEYFPHCRGQLCQNHQQGTDRKGNHHQQRGAGLFQNRQGHAADEGTRRGRRYLCGGV